MKSTETVVPDYFHRIVNCQWSCPAHTPVPEYLRLVADGRFGDAYMLNWQANVFPGVLGRVCDRPCEPACRRARVEGVDGKDPVAVCRLKRAAADYKEDVRPRVPKPAPRIGKRVACVGAGPASLTVARDLAVLGYQVVVFDGEQRAGGFMRSQIPRFRLPESVLDEEVDYVLSLGVEFRRGERIESMKALLAQDYDAIFVGSGAPRGRDLDIPGRREASRQIHIGIDWLASVSFGHVTRIGARVIVLGGGNTAMDCCRSALRLGGEDVKVIVRSGYEEMKASEWEKEDARHEGVTILNYMVPKAFVHEGGSLTGMLFEKVRAVRDKQGKRVLLPTGEADEYVECDEVLIAVGQENAFPWIERDIGLRFDDTGMPQVDRSSMQSTLPNVFFGGDAAFGPKNIITAVAHGHEAAISIDRYCHEMEVSVRPHAGGELVSQKMGIHEWSFDNVVSLEHRHKVPLVDIIAARKSIRLEVERGFAPAQAAREAQRCLNCDVQSVFSEARCIECDACIDICPMDCLTLTENGDEAELRTRLKAPVVHAGQALYVSATLKTGRVMVKDEDLCLHCSLCAERCPTGAWDMQKFTLHQVYAGPRARDIAWTDMQENLK